MRYCCYDSTAFPIKKDRLSAVRILDFLWVIRLPQLHRRGNHKHPNTQQTSQGVSGGEGKRCRRKSSLHRVFGQPFHSLRLLYSILETMSRGQRDSSRNSHFFQRPNPSNRFSVPNRRFANSKNRSPAARASAEDR